MISIIAAIAIIVCVVVLFVITLFTLPKLSNAQSESLFHDAPKPTAVCDECGSTNVRWDTAKVDTNGMIYDWGGVATCKNCGNLVDVR